jgi:hypothetical protein
MTGGIAVTTTLKDGHEAWLPALSVAVHVTDVEPRLKVRPDAGGGCAALDGFDGCTGQTGLERQVFAP